MQTNVLIAETSIGLGRSLYISGGGGADEVQKIPIAVQHSMVR